MGKRETQWVPRKYSWNLSNGGSLRWAPNRQITSQKQTILSLQQGPAALEVRANKDQPHFTFSLHYLSLLSLLNHCSFTLFYHTFFLFFFPLRSIKITRARTKMPVSTRVAGKPTIYDRPSRVGGRPGMCPPDTRLIEKYPTHLATANCLAQWNLYHPNARPGQPLPYYDTIEFDNNGNFVEPPPGVALSDALVFLVVSCGSFAVEWAPYLKSLS